jgi:ribokinase
VGRVVVVGSVNVDRVARVGALPGAGETVIAASVSLGFGGKGGNQAAAAARLGAATWMIAAIGDDAAGSSALADLVTHGVRVERVRRPAGTPTGEAIVVVDDHGENLIVVVPGANALLSGANVTADLGALDLGVDDVVLTSAEINDDCLAAAETVVRRFGSRIVLNLAPARPLAEWMCAPHVVLVVNEPESMQVSGASSPTAALDSLASRVGAVVVTRGSHGAALAQGGTVLELAAPAVDVVDSTGAGDALCGALAAELAIGRQLAAAVRTGVLAGAVAVTAAGARGALATRAALASFGFTPPNGGPQSTEIA